jgi:hypothetical protein
MPVFRSGMKKAILPAWLLAGTMDGLAACIHYYIKTGRDPGPVFRYIASAVFGKKAYAGGLPMALAGALFHYLVAFLFTLFFMWLYPRVKWMRKSIAATAVAYGLFVWLVMNRIVVPLAMSGTFKAAFYWKQAGIALAILIVCIGLPLSLVARKYYLYEK